MSAIALMLRRVFADKNVSVEAIFYPKVGAETPLRVIFKQGDTYQDIGQSSFRVSPFSLEVLKKDCPCLMAGDQFRVGGQLYTVQGEPLSDKQDLVWRVNCYAS